MLTANFYRLERGQRAVECENYYEEDLPKVTIPLDPLLTPQQNAEKYYKRYTKAKTAERYLSEQMALARRDLAYLNDVADEIEEAESDRDFADIRMELRDAGFLRGQGKGRKEKQKPTRPREFRTVHGFRVLVGRNHAQNDRLTLHDAESHDLWFHTQKIHGSHVVLFTEGGVPPEEDILQAALIAAYYSQARESAQVPVDYTPVRYVKKPAGARPGMVIYSTCRTLYVTPEKEQVAPLEWKGR